MRAAGLLDNPGERRIVKVAHPREQVVLHLEVEAAEEPAQQRIPAREVDRRRHLVLGPVRLDAAADELGLAHAVRELEDGGEHVAERKKRESPEQHQLPRRMKEGRQHERPADEERLSGQCNQQRSPACRRELAAAAAAGCEVARLAVVPALEREKDAQPTYAYVLDAAIGMARWAVGRAATPLGRP